MNADTNMDTNTAIMMRFQEWITKMSLNPTVLKFTAPTVQVCTKASMQAMRTAFALDLASTVTSINAELFIVTFALRESPDRKGSAGDACVIDLMRVSPAPATATIR